jgi:hypothetical protein
MAVDNMFLEEFGARAPLPSGRAICTPLYECRRLRGLAIDVRVAGLEGLSATKRIVNPV